MPIVGGLSLASCCLAATLTVFAFVDVGSTTENPPLQTPIRVQQGVTLAPGTADALLPDRFGPAVEQLSFGGTAMQTASGGASVYSEMCALCHGPGGEGGIGPSLVEGSLSVEAFADVVTNGRDAMPSFGTRLEASEIEAVVSYLESLRSAPSTTTTSSAAQPDSAAADLFADHCALCHGPGGEGGIGPSLVEGSLSVEAFADVVTNGRDAMPSFGTRLDASEIEVVGSYLESLRSAPSTATTTAADLQPSTVAAGLFAQHCALCHGPKGAGRGPIGPPLHLSDVHVDDVVTVVTKGRGLMPLFSETLEEAEIEEVALYVVSLRAENAAPATLSPTASAAEIFAFECSGCHGVDGEGGYGPRLVDRSLSPDRVAAAISGGFAMGPHFRDRLDSGQIEALGGFVADLRTPEEQEDEDEPTGPRADLIPVIVYLCIVALVAFKLLIDYRKIQEPYSG